MAFAVFDPRIQAVLNANQANALGPPDVAALAMQGIAGIGKSFAGAFDQSRKYAAQDAVSNLYKNAPASGSLFGDLAKTYAPPGATTAGGPASPQETFTGKPLSGDIDTLVKSTADKYGLSPDYLTRLVQTESSGNPNAVSSTGAKGLTQFTGGTWKQYGQGGNPFDPATNLDAAARFTLANKAELSAALGREPTAGELYLAHQQGVAGAKALLTNPGAKAVDVVPAKHVLVNGGNSDMTAGQFAAKWTGRFGGVGAAPAPVVAAGGAEVAPGAYAAAGAPEPAPRPVLATPAPAASPTATVPDAPTADDVANARAILQQPTSDPPLKAWATAVLARAGGSSRPADAPAPGAQPTGLSITAEPANGGFIIPGTGQVVPAPASPPSAAPAAAGGGGGNVAPVPPAPPPHPDRVAQQAAANIIPGMEGPINPDLGEILRRLDPDIQRSLIAQFPAMARFLPGPAGTAAAAATPGDPNQAAAQAALAAAGPGAAPGGAARGVPPVPGAVPPAAAGPASTGSVGGPGAVGRRGVPDTNALLAAAAGDPDLFRAVVAQANAGGDRLGIASLGDGRVLQYDKQTGDYRIVGSGAPAKEAPTVESNGQRLQWNPATGRYDIPVGSGSGFRPMTPEERKTYGVPEGTGGFMGPDGKPATLRGTNSTTINNQPETKGDVKWQEETAKATVEQFRGYQAARDKSQRQQPQLASLQQAFANVPTGGKLNELKAIIGPWAAAAGIDVGNLDDIQTVQSVIEQLAPQQRAVGSGSQSDAEYRGFLRSLPTLMQNPETRERLLAMLQANAELDQKRGALADLAFNGEIDRAEARKRLAELPKEEDLWAKFKTENRDLYNQAQRDAAARRDAGRPEDIRAAREKSLEAPPGELKPGTIVRGYLFKGGDPNDKNSWVKQ